MNLEEVLDDAVAANARLEQQNEMLGQQLVANSERLRRTGQSLLEFQHIHPEHTDEIESMRRYIWGIDETKHPL